MKWNAVGGLVVAMVLGGGTALAQEPEKADASAPTESPGESEEPRAEASVASRRSTSDAGDADGTRFRFGVAAGGGLLSGSDSFGSSATYGYGGVDLRFGAQINDLVGVYAQPQLGFYGANGGIGGLAGATVLADFTFLDQFVVGAGVGYAVLNNPAGPVLHFRGGMYPIYGGGAEEARRKGLLLGVDVRVHLLDGATFIAPTFNIGFELY